MHLRYDKPDLYFGIAAVVLSVFLMFQTFGFSVSITPAPLRTTFFPQVLLVLMGLLGVLMILRSQRDAAETSTTDWRQLLAPATLAVGLVVYVWAMPLLGYYIDTLLLLSLSLALFRQRNWVMNLAVCAGVLLVTYLLFERTLGVLLPHGALIEGLV